MVDLQHLMIYLNIFLRRSYLILTIQTHKIGFCKMPDQVKLGIETKIQLIQMAILKTNKEEKVIFNYIPTCICLLSINNILVGQLVQQENAKRRFRVIKIIRRVSTVIMDEMEADNHFRCSTWLNLINAHEGSTVIFVIHIFLID